MPIVESEADRARELAEQHYSVDLYADRLAALYREVAQKASTPLPCNQSVVADSNRSGTYGRPEGDPAGL